MRPVGSHFRLQMTFQGTSSPYQGNYLRDRVSEWSDLTNGQSDAVTKQSDRVNDLSKLITPYLLLITYRSDRLTGLAKLITDYSLLMHRREKHHNSKTK